MATIRERNGRHTATVRKAGQPSISQTFSTRKKAESWARRLETQIEDGDLHVTKKRTLADAIDRHLKNHDLDTAQRNILMWWRANAENYDGQTLGSKKLQMLRRSDFVEAREQLQGLTSRSGKPLAPATINRRMARISAVLTDAMEWDWITTNPARVRVLTENNERDRLLTPAEVERLLEAALVSDEPDLHTFIVTAMLSGGRAGELQGLRWQDIDLERGVGYLMNTKNDERRPIPIRGLAKELLLEKRRARPVALLGGDDFVFKNKSGNVPFSYRAAWEEARIGIPDIRFHDLRHLAASHLAMAGATSREVQAILGHKTAAMTKRYSHLFDSHVAELGDRLAERIFGD